MQTSRTNEQLLQGRSATVTRGLASREEDILQGSPCSKGLDSQFGAGI